VSGALDPPDRPFMEFADRIVAAGVVCICTSACRPLLRQARDHSWRYPIIMAANLFGMAYVARGSPIGCHGAVETDGGLSV